MMNKTIILKPKLSNCIVCEKLAKITRRYDGEPYCGNCYPQWFPKKTCAQCQLIKRIHLRSNICVSCEKLTDCVRCCKKAGTFKIGKMSGYGAVCNSCYIYFREKKSCFECGKLSHSVSRTPLAEHNELLCISCFRKYSFATCSNCGRYRKIHNEEKHLCNKCNKAILSICPKCNNEMPSGYGSICSTCAKRRSLCRLLQLNCKLLPSNSVKTSYKKFIFWYIKKSSLHITLYRSKYYLPFFIACNDKWQKIPNYEKLLTHFTPNGLRRYLTVLRWLQDTNQIFIDGNLKTEIAETKRIKALFNKLPKTLPCITSYHEELKQKHTTGRITLKSVRLALQPAVDLIVSHKVTTLPLQHQINSYLAIKTGQTAAITGFITHLKQKYNCELEVNRRIIQRIKKKRLQNQFSHQLIVLYRQEKLTELEKMALVSATLYCLHNVLIKKPERALIHKIDGNYFYHESQNEYFIPKDIILLLT